VSPHGSVRVAPGSSPAGALPCASPAEGLGADEEPGAALDREEWLSPRSIIQRQAALGLGRKPTSTYTANCEFVPLGCYCAVTVALRALGLRRFAYPFDWVRCPADGIIHCLEGTFADFLTFTRTGSGPTGTFFAATQWGGSFWHHDPLRPRAREDFTRRAERLMGLREVAPSVPRVFVWAANSTRELAATLRLYAALRKALAGAPKLHLLVLVDLQSQPGFLRLAGAVENGSILVCRVHESLYSEGGRHWTMRAQSEAYAEAVAKALRLWAADEDIQEVPEVEDLAGVRAACDSFDGGNPAAELFLPRSFIGQPIALSRGVSAPLEEGAETEAAASEAASSPHADGQEEPQQEQGEEQPSKGLFQGLFLDRCQQICLNRNPASPQGVGKEVLTVN